MSAARFFVKLPLFETNGVRAMLIYAKLDPHTPNKVNAILQRVDGQQVGVQMDLARAARAQRNGPFVLLAEVDGDPGALPRGTIIGLNGQPLKL